MPMESDQSVGSLGDESPIVLQSSGAFEMAPTMDHDVSWVSNFSHTHRRYAYRTLLGSVLVIATIAACTVYMLSNDPVPEEDGSQRSAAMVPGANTTSTLTSSTRMTTTVTTTRTTTTTTATTTTTTLPDPVKLNVLTWNQGLGTDSTQFTQRIASQDVDVVAMCQQESGAGLITPEGWEQVFTDSITGMTKVFSFKLANIYLTVLKRKDSKVVVKVPKHGGVRVSVSGKGSVWAEIQMWDTRSAQESCASAAVVCTHLPTAVADRAAALISVLDEVAAAYDCPVASGMIPAKDCWGSLHSVMITGDMNYRLDAKLLQPSMQTDGKPPQTDAELLVWLRRAMSEKRWKEMLLLDTIAHSGLLSSDVGFTCGSPETPPTYKVKKSNDGCSDDKLENCFLPENKKLPKKGDEISLGWLDRVCWLERSSHITLASDEWLYDLIADSDHVPVEFSFQLVTNQDSTCMSSPVANFAA